VSDNVIFMIESGKMLALVKDHLKQRARAHREGISLVKELGADQYRVFDDDGKVFEVIFSSCPRHPDFTVPKKSGSRPKRGTEWAKRFAAQVGFKPVSGLIAEALGIPLSIASNSTDVGMGRWRVLGYPLRECGFIYPSLKGPYAFYTPNVPAEVACEVALGQSVEEPAASFKLEFEGCRRITEEEWNFIVARHKFKKQKAYKQGEAS